MTGTRWLTLCCLVGVLALVPAAGASADTTMADEVNRFRAAHGLKALRYSPSLTRSSTRFAHRQMSRGRFGHASRIMASSRFRALGEVLSVHRGWSPKWRSVVRRWSRSHSHRSVLLSARFRYVGAGWARGRLGRRRTSMWVVQVGR
jgi:uncharacterized protein YkwD